MQFNDHLIALQVNIFNNHWNSLYSYFTCSKMALSYVTSHAKAKSIFMDDSLTVEDYKE